LKTRFLPSNHGWVFEAEVKRVVFGRVSLAELHALPLIARDANDLG